jgi:hypothetical protein
MPISHALWTVGAQPSEVSRGTLATEQQLEEMIVAAPRILSDEWMLVGRQEDTGHGGRVDLLAIAPDGSLVLVELKRNRTPREVVAQALDYAAWVENLESEHVAAIYARFRPGRSLADDFRAQFGLPLDEETLNDTHQIVVVASSLDASSERIVGYLNRRGVAINVLFFEVFNHGEQKLLSRAWLIDPIDVQVQAAGAVRGREQEPWNGEFYVSFGESSSRRWEEAVRYGFISGGGGAWYSNTLRMLNEGDRVWVKIPGKGFVGVGKVIGPRTSAADFMVEGRPALEVLQAEYHRDSADDPERVEYFVPVRWLQTVTMQQAVQEVGMFGNQNTVCKPRTPLWRTTVERLKARFPAHAAD